MKKGTLTNRKVPIELKKLLIQTASLGTGVAKRLKRPELQALGEAAQSIIQHGLWGPTYGLINQLIQDGKIPSRYFPDTDRGRYSLQELFNFLQTEHVDKDRWSVLQDIAIAAAIADEQQDMNPVEYMKIIQKLEAVEVRILLAAYRISKEIETNSAAPYPRGNGIETSAWVEYVQKESGLPYVEMVYQHEEHLVELKLINAWSHGDKSGVRLNPHFRLGDLGYAIFDYAAKIPTVEKHEND